MAEGQLDSVLRHIRRLIGLPCAADWSDGQLLERFASYRDEAAFETLLQRHGPLVLGVCQRVLRDPQAAEDAFQATFLVLARKAASIRKHESISSWLHGVAYRLAVRAKTDAARRRAYERQVVPMPASDPMAEVLRRELRPVLDEELNRLPEKYRAPLVLCYLQGKTNEQAARELGWPPGTMSRRLARARELLRIRLTGRGVTLSSLLLLATLAEEASALPVPTTLIRSTLSAALVFAAGQAGAAGVISGQAIALANGVLKAMLITRLTIVAVVMVVLGLGSGAGLLAYQTWVPRHREAHTALAAKDAVPSEPAGGKLPRSVSERGNLPEIPPQRFSFSGRVVDSNGKPIAAASVFLREAPTSWSQDALLRRWYPSQTRNLARAASDEQGQFRFREVELGKPDQQRNRLFPLDLIVTAKGHGLAWRHLPQPYPKLPVELILPPEAELRGRLLDVSGNPVAGARVQVILIAELHHVVQPFLYSGSYVDLQYAEVPLDTKTDAEGRFILKGLPHNMRATLRCSADGFLPREVYAATTDQPQPAAAEDPYHLAPGERRSAERLPGTSVSQNPPLPVYTGDFSVRLEPSHRVHGRILFEDTGKPVAGAGVAYLVYPPKLSADAKGEFFVDHLLPGKCTLGIYPPQNTDYLGVRTELEIAADKGEVIHTIRLPRGAIVSGRVVDDETGMGIAEVPIQYWPTPEQAKTMPYPWTTRTKSDGTFRLAVPPGKGKLVIVGRVPGYTTYNQSGSLSDVDRRWVREVDANRAQPITGVHFTLSRGSVVKGQALDPDGRPVRAEIVSRHLFERSHLDLSWSTDAEGKFTMSGLRAYPNNPLGASISVYS